MPTNPTTHRRSGSALLLVTLLATPHAAFAQAPSTPPNTAPGTPATTPATATFGTEPAAPAQSCGAAYEKAQTEKVAGHYVAASAAALQCSQLECNAAIVRECVRFYESLEQDTPTLVFSARKAEGGELDDVRVEIDGKPAVDHITGRPLAVDPGPHQFVFIHPKRGRMEVTEIARVGDHARVIEATFVDPLAKAAPAAAATAPAAPPPEAQRSHRVPVMTYVLGGVGVVALGSFIYFRVKGVNDYNEYNATCSPYCHPDDVDAVRREFLFSYVSLGVSIASIAGAGLVYVLAPGKSGEHAVQASVSAHGDGALVGLRTKF